MANLIVCNTPYQIFNAVNIVINKIEGCDKTNTDIVIEKLFNNAEQLCVRLKTLNLFRIISTVSMCRSSVSGGKIKAFWRLMNIDKELDNYMFSYKSMIMNNYDKIWIGDASILGLIFLNKNKNTEILLYDDGLSSYSKNPLDFSQSTAYKICGKLFKLGIYRYRIKKLYLNNKEIGQGNRFQKIQLPSFLLYNPAREILKSLFEYDQKASYLNRFKIIILGQMFEELQGYNDYGLTDLFSHIDTTQILLRKHPRDQTLYQNYVIDNGKNMWEMECMENITNEHVLISLCSTAQFCPKMIANKEPSLIFLYKIMLNKNSSLVKDYDLLTENLIRDYKDKTRIYIPCDLYEFNTVLKRFL
jgi:hypothetical protein